MEDNSAGETGYEVEQQNNAGAWVVIGTADADATTFAFDSSEIGTGSSMTNNVRVRAVGEDAEIDTAPVEATPSELASVTNLNVELSKRIIVMDGEDYLYDAGVAHAGETITISNAENGGSTANAYLVPGTYPLGPTGQASIPTHVVTLPYRPDREIVTFPGGDEGVIVAAAVRLRRESSFDQSDHWCRHRSNN